MPEDRAAWDTLRACRRVRNVRIAAKKLLNRDRGLVADAMAPPMHGDFIVLMEVADFGLGY